jgi:hypothetical protein
VPAASRDSVNNVDTDDVEIISLPFSFFFKFESGRHALEALHARFFKHVKAYLDCAGRYPGARKRATPPAPKVSTLATQRHAYRVELFEQSNKAAFGEARLSIAWDGWDLPDNIAGDSPEVRLKLREHLRSIVRIDIALETRRQIPIALDTAVQTPADVRSLALLDQTFLEQVFTAFQWATWMNEPFANTVESAMPEHAKTTLRELLETHFAGSDLANHYLVQHDQSQMLKFRRLLLREAKVDFLVPWDAALLGEAPWLHSAFDYARRLNPSSDPQFAPYCLTPANTPQAIEALSLSGT